MISGTIRSHAASLKTKRSITPKAGRVLIEDRRDTKEGLRCRGNAEKATLFSKIDDLSVLVFAPMLSLARGYFDETILLFLSPDRVHQEPLLVDGFDDERRLFI
jgi:hypothetical protein